MLRAGDGARGVSRDLSAVRQNGNGDPRFQCRLCSKTVSINKQARRHLRSDKSRVDFQMLCNDVSLSMICKLTVISTTRSTPSTTGFTVSSRSVRISPRVDPQDVGSRFATDSQALMLNWPTKRKRTPVAVQHLCTAHHRSGFIIEAAYQFDPTMAMDPAEEQALAANEESLSVAFRQHARIWTKTQLQIYLVRLKKRQKADLYQLPHQGVLVCYDILLVCPRLSGPADALRGVCAAPDGDR